MKKKAMLGLSMCSALLMGTASASVPNDELVVGGIEYDASAEYVRSVYGEPTEVEVKPDQEFYNGSAVEYEYGDSFELFLLNSQVRRIEIDRHNGIKTKAGIEVGSTLAQVKAAYGEPDKVRHDKYIYYSQDRSDIGFVFEIEDDKVHEIEMGYIFQ